MATKSSALAFDFERCTYLCASTIIRLALEYTPVDKLECRHVRQSRVYSLIPRRMAQARPLRCLQHRWAG